MKKNKPFVISIAAVSGGGKTTIAKQLHEELEQSRILYFDNYDFEGPDDIINWVDRGADYEEWDLQPLLSDLERIINESFHYIILDYPFARLHSQINDYINLAVFIDTPLDIAMARRIRRDFEKGTSREIMNEMGHYVSVGRRGYLEMLNSVKPNSDLVVDGSLTVSEIIEEIYHRLTNSNTSKD